MFERLMEEIVRDANVQVALKAVIANGGAPGIDRKEVDYLPGFLGEHWPVIRQRLLEGKFVPTPVKKVSIPKPDGGERELGIPTVFDRFVQQLILQVLTPIFDPTFSEHSYGFRPGRSAHDAIRKSQNLAREGKNWVVDLDISQFFDCVNHDILMRNLEQTISDKRLLKLIRKYLSVGYIQSGVRIKVNKGTPQGGPLSPLLANIYLDPLDKELEKRGLPFVRYADDCNIYVSSRAAAERAYHNISMWLKSKLKLDVNSRKSGIGRTWERKFLGFEFTEKLEIQISKRSIQRFKDKVRELWRDCQSGTSNELRNRWRSYVKGWWGYYQLSEDRSNILAIEGWIRRHIRKFFWLRWHCAKGRLRKLKKLGVKGKSLGVAYSSLGAWRLARTPTMHAALSNKKLQAYGFLVPSNLVAT